MNTLTAALHHQDRNIAAALELLSPQREAERQARFQARMNELARIRGELALLLSSDQPAAGVSEVDVEADASNEAGDAAAPAQQAEMLEER